MIFFGIFVVLMALSVFSAWLKGGAPEKIVASLFLIAWLASIALYWGQAGRFRHSDLISLGMNILMFLVLMAVAISANRAWPRINTSLQLLIVAAQIARLARPEWMWQLYMIMTAVWPFLQLLIVIAGTLAHWRREARLGAERSWRNLSAKTELESI